MGFILPITIQQLRKSLLLSVAALTLLTQASCSEESNSVITNLGLCTRNLVAASHLNSSAQEEPYCSETQAVADGVTITGSATFQARKIDTSATPVEGLLAVGSPEAIRYAEIIVENESGDRIQCGETDSTGHFNILVPRSISKYKIRILSRANNDHLKTSVKVCPENEKVYALETEFFADSDKSLGTLNAEGTGDILGAAFNIFNQVLVANDFLRSKVGTCSSTYSGCPDFTVAPKSNIYWEKGFNPNRYFSSNASDTSSYYIPSHNKLFILGGVLGDVDQSDTDHFDNSVVLHEYGHFLENMYYSSDSPGGFHSGTTLLDPRLAWSEGWGNFIQGAILDFPYYVDTLGNVDGFTQDIFRVKMEDQDSVGILDKPCSDCGPNDSHVPEGNFREFTITRALWDIVDAENDGETVSDGFDQIWATMTSTTKGFNEDFFRFKSMGAFYERREALMTASSQSPPAWTDIINLHDQVANRNDYALWVAVKSDGGACGSTYSTTPTDRLSNNVKISALSSGAEADAFVSYSLNFFRFANYLHNSDFLHYYHDGGQANFKLTYTTNTGTTNADLDLYLYKASAEGQSYEIGVADYLVEYTQGVTLPDGTFGTQQTETLNVSNLEAGHYLIHVNTFYDDPGDEFNNQTDYAITIDKGAGEKYLCPTTFPNQSL